MLNIFLCEAFYNRILYDRYQLERMGSFLEVALDDMVAGRLWSDANRDGLRLPRFRGVKYLTPEVSRQYQDYALRHARDHEFVLRVDLEILYWRGEA